jgi:hypothetical protein
MRRALLIGAQTYGLQGVEPDVAAMEAALGPLGFTVRCRIGSQATRRGILDAYRGLIDETGADDMALVYFSGHGGFVEPGPGEALRPGDNRRQFIVPTDFEESAPGDFRGVGAVELSALLAELTTKTGNAAVILDCCHAAVMSRGDLGEARVRQIGAVRADLDDLRRRALADGLRLDLVRREGNETAVRLVACAQDEAAHEIRRGDGSPGRNGVLTLALVQALAEVSGRSVTWSRLFGRVRHLMRVLLPHQRPTVEGPSQRLLFETGTEDSADWLYVTDTGDERASLAGALLLGVQPGDEFAIRTGSGDAIGTLRIDRIDPRAASGPLIFDGVPEPLPADARAYRTRGVAARLPVRLPPSLREAIGPADFLAGPAEEAAVEVLESADGSLTIHDRIGPLHRPRRPGPDTTARIRADLNRIGRATALSGLRDEEPEGDFDPPVGIEWGSVRPGGTHSLPVRGATVRAGELVYFRIRNNAAAAVYVSLIDIGVSYAIGVLSELDPSGIKVGAGQEYVYGVDDLTGRLVGAELSWPDTIDPGAPRPETVLVLITSEPHDVTVLAQEWVGGRGRARSALDELLEHFGAGGGREFRRTASYSLRAIEFTVDPGSTG